MVTINDIKEAKTCRQIHELVEQSAREHNIELYSTLSYKEQAIFVEEECRWRPKMCEFAEILYAAEYRWFELKC